MYASGARVWHSTATIVATACLLAACGFHLRGTGSSQLPASLAQLRLVAAGIDTNGPLMAALRQTLTTQPGVTLTARAQAPTLSIIREQIDSQVLSVRTATAKAAEYQLRYSVEFEVRDAAGQPLLAPQTLKLTRDYTFDPAHVLAKEREEQELLRELRRDAAQQIVRRLSRIKTG